VSSRKVVRETVIHYIMREVVKTSPEMTFQAGYQSSLEKQSFQDFTVYLHANVLPHYRVPFVPYVDKTGKTVDPILMDYALPYVDRIPRWLHGPSHISRSVIWGMAHITLDRRYFYRRIDDPLAILFAISAHDRKRKSEGREEWDKESGEVVKLELLKLPGCPVGYAQMVGDGIARKRKRETIYQRTVDGVDCIEILRLRKFKENVVLLYEGGEKDVGFRTWELPIFQNLCAIGMKDYAVAWLQEMHRFIQLTEEPTVKIEFETKSKNLIVDHLCYLQNAHAQANCFPILTDLLQEWNKQLKI
jgi:hypothetical protein